MLHIDAIHYYPHPATRTNEAFCGLRIYNTETGAVVILSELADNPGISVTNAIEQLATEIAKRYALNPKTTTWIEHYGPFSYYPQDGDDPNYETFDKITFAWRDNIASAPQWKRLSQEQVQALLPDDDININAATPPNEITEQQWGIFVVFHSNNGDITARFFDSYNANEIKTITAQFTNGVPPEWQFDILNPAVLESARTMPIIAGKQGSYVLAPANTIDFTAYGGIAKAQEEATLWNKRQWGTQQQNHSTK